MNFRIWYENNIDLSELIKPLGKVHYIGPEKSVQLSSNIYKFISPHGSYRYVYIEDDNIVSALQVVSTDKKTGTVSQVYTDPNFQRQKLATQLYQIASRDFSLTYSKHRSDAGEGFYNSLERDE